MTPEAETIIRSAFTLIRADSDPALHELIESVERLTELGLDPINTRVAQEADALLLVRTEVMRRAAALMERKTGRGVLYEIPGGLA